MGILGQEYSHVVWLNERRNVKASFGSRPKLTGEILGEPSLLYTKEVKVSIRKFSQEYPNHRKGVEGGEMVTYIQKNSSLQMDWNFSS